MSPEGTALVLYKRLLDIEPFLTFEADDYMVTASWPSKDGGITCASRVVFDVADFIPLLKYIYRCLT